MKQQVTPKASNLNKAWKSTLLGIAIAIMTTTMTIINDGGQVTWKAVLAASIPAILLGFTNLFNEVKKTLDEPTND